MAMVVYKSGKTKPGTPKQKSTQLSAGPSKRSSRGKKKNVNRQVVSSTSMSGGGSVMAAAAYTQSLPTGKPKFGGSVDCVRVQHREFVQDLTTTTLFSVTSGAINPGQQGLFPWLSQLAPMFESYRFNRLRFLIVPMVGSQTAGQVFQAIDYDAADPAPLSKTEMLAYAGSEPMAIWQPFAMDARGRNEQTLGKRRFVRTGAVPVGTDIKTYDVGTLFVGSAGAAGSAVTSSLFVEYDVELETPVFSLSSIASAASSRIASGGTTSKTAIFGTAATYTGNLPVTASGNTLTFAKAGQYLIDYLVQGSGLADAANPTMSGTATSTSTVGTLANAAGGAGSFQQIVEVTEPGQTLISDWSGVATTITSALVRAGLYAYSLG